MSKGKFIVIDGLDGSGKGTQFRILVQKLKELNYDIAEVDFPRYGKPSAVFVERYLRGEFGTADQVKPKAASIFYALDRFGAKEEMRDDLEKGKILISNRYVSSSQGHQAGKIKDSEQRKAFLNWLDELEYEIFGIPRPDLGLFMDVPPEIGQKLVDQKESREYIQGKKRDIHEDDLNHLENAYQAYQELVASDSAWEKIDCVRQNGKIKTIEEISELVLKRVLELIKN
jgi:dTMP kinase